MSEDYRERARKAEFYADEFAEALRALLSTPMVDPLHPATLIRCHAILQCFDEDAREESAARLAA